MPTAHFLKLQLRISSSCILPICKPPRSVKKLLLTLFKMSSLHTSTTPLPTHITHFTILAPQAHTLQFSIVVLTVTTPFIVSNITSVTFAKVTVTKNVPLKPSTEALRWILSQSKISGPVIIVNHVLSVFSLSEQIEFHVPSVKLPSMMSVENSNHRTTLFISINICAKIVSNAKYAKKNWKTSTIFSLRVVINVWIVIKHRKQMRYARFARDKEMGDGHSVHDSSVGSGYTRTVMGTFNLGATFFQLTTRKFTFVLCADEWRSVG